MPKFEVQGMVERIPGANGECSSVLASGGCVKTAANAEILRAKWLSDMKLAFGDIGSDYNIEFHVRVLPVADETPEGPVPPKFKLHMLDPPPTYKDITPKTSRWEIAPPPKRGLVRRVLDAIFQEAA